MIVLNVITEILVADSTRQGLKLEKSLLLSNHRILSKHVMLYLPWPLG